MTDLIVHRAIALQKHREQLRELHNKVFSVRLKAAVRYLGPLIILLQNKGGVYIIAELDSSVFDRPVAAFRVIPYFACTKLDIPPLEELINIS